MWDSHDRLLEISTPRYFAQVMQDFIMKFVGGFESKTLLKTAPGEGGGEGWGVCSLANYSVAYEETQSNRVSDFRDFVWSLFSKAIHFDFYLIGFLDPVSCTN